MRQKIIVVIVLVTLIGCILITLDEVTFPCNNVPIVYHLGIFVTYCLRFIYISYMLLQFCTILAIIKQQYNWLNQQIECIAALCNKHLLQNKNKNTKSNGKLYL